MDKQKAEKTYLLDQIDMAIIKAKSRYEGMDTVERINMKAYGNFDFSIDSKQFGTINLKLGNGCSFTIVNTKESLLKFRKIAERKFPGTMATLNKSHPQPKYPSIKRRGNLEELLYVANLNRESGVCVP